MPDYEKTIKQIANCVHDGLCDGCEYKKHTACRHFMLADALALLKKQNTVEYALSVLKKHGWMEDKEDA